MEFEFSASCPPLTEIKGTSQKPYITTGLKNGKIVLGRLPIAGKYGGNMRTKLSLATLTIALSACSLFTPDNAGSRFAAVSGNQIAVEIEGERNRYISDPSVGTVAFMTGYTVGPDGFILPEVTGLAYSGIAPGYDVGATVASGTANYEAQYGWLVIDNAQASFFGISRRLDSGGGSIVLTADFDAGTFSGTASSLTVDGTIRGSRLSGGVEIFYNTYGANSIAGTLTGHVGATGTIGAFHGNDDDTAASGGFVGPSN